MPYEGQTGTAPDGTKVVYRGGKVYPLGQDPAPKTAALSPQDSNYLNELRTDSDTVLKGAKRAEEFMRLNKTTATGPGYKAPLLGIDIPFIKEPKWGSIREGLPGGGKFQQMQSITADQAPKQRPDGAGSSSNFDVEMFLKSLPNVEKYGTTNAMGAKYLHGESDRLAARSSFMETWAQKRGNLLGAEAAFKDFWRRRSAGDPVANNVAGAQRPAANVFQGKFGTVRPVGE